MAISSSDMDRWMDELLFSRSNNEGTTHLPPDQSRSPHKLRLHIGNVKRTSSCRLISHCHARPATLCTTRSRVHPPSFNSPHPQPSAVAVSGIKSRFDPVSSTHEIAPKHVLAAHVGMTRSRHVNFGRGSTDLGWRFQRGSIVGRHRPTSTP